MIKINLNQEACVRLTEFGAKVYNEVKLPSQMELQSGDCLKLQVWRLFQIFGGSIMAMSQPEVFDRCRMELLSEIEDPQESLKAPPNSGWLQLQELKKKVALLERKLISMDQVLAEHVAKLNALSSHNATLHERLRSIRGEREKLSAWVAQCYEEFQHLW